MGWLGKGLVTVVLPSQGLTAFSEDLRIGHGYNLDTLVKPKVEVYKPPQI